MPALYPQRSVRLLFLVGALALACPVSEALGQSKPKPVLFCFWNVENLFDDKPDKREPPDSEFDTWFAKNAEARKQKLDKICAVLLDAGLMNDGKGPDIIALAEVESQRAVELVQQGLNARLKDPALHYKTVVYRDPGGKRNIATAILTRLKVKPEKTRILGSQQRILKVVFEVEGQELVVIASHWTSRVSDKIGRGRSHYAEVIYNDFKAAYKNNPKVDYLVCGDFNDNPDDASVTRALHATGDVKAVLDFTGDPPLFNAFADKQKKGDYGSHYAMGNWCWFDQVCLSPGLLDGEGWSYRNNSAQIIRKFEFRGRPDRFGGPMDERPWHKRGASDHFPVTVEFRVGK
jgi:endonuclease/exonuclease/phosphatase family metal-dependent hydrolase